MRTRKLSAGKDEKAKDVLASSHQGDSLDSKTFSSPIVRKLRSRVITSDTEDDAHVKSKTSKSQRKAIKETSTSSPSNKNEVTKACNELSRIVGMPTRTPKPNKRLSAVNLFMIEEEKDFNIEETSVKVREEAHSKTEISDVLSNTDAITCNDNAPAQETAQRPNRVAKEDLSLLGLNGGFSNRENFTAIKEEPTELNEAHTDEPKKNDLIDCNLSKDLDSDDEMPEAVSFSSSRNTSNVEMAKFAEAIRREKEKRKDRTRRKIEMIKMQKAEKEKKRKQKLKLLEVSFPKRLPEDVTSSLSDIPDIPTVRKSVPIDRKRKTERKEALELRVEEKRNKITKFDDYIPITGIGGSTQFGVVPLEVTSCLPKSSSHSAAEFKKMALFGSRIRREPSKNLLIYKQKLSAAGKLQKGYKTSRY